MHGVIEFTQMVSLSSTHFARKIYFITTMQIYFKIVIC